ncbi:MAG: PQQ-dependent catabolism-associated beta-propeller protein [Gammaproteobacteria bacterium]
MKRLTLAVLMLAALSACSEKKQPETAVTEPAETQQAAPAATEAPASAAEAASPAAPESAAAAEAPAAETQQAAPAAAGGPTGRVFVTNERGNSVSVIDPANNTVIATIDVGAQPRGIGKSPDGSEIYVALGEEGKIAVVDPKEMKLVRKFDSGPDPEAFGVHPDGNIYISMEADAKAAVYNPKTGEQIALVDVGLEPEGVAVSPDGSKVIVTSESTNMLHVISVPDHQLVANILVGSRPRAATFSRDGKWAYASAEIGGEVKRVNMTTHEVDKVTSIGEDEAKPKDVLLSNDEKTLYVAGGRANKIFLFDAESMELRSSIPVGNRVWGLALSKDGSRLYTTDGGSDQVSVIDTAKNEVVATIAVGKAPWGVVVDD